MSKEIEYIDPNDLFDDEEDTIEEKQPNPPVVKVEPKATVVKKEIIKPTPKVEPKQEIKQVAKPDVKQEIEYKTLTLKEKLRYNEKAREEKRQEVPLEKNVKMKVKPTKKRKIKQIGLTQTDEELENIIDNLPVAVDKFVNYLKKYKNIIYILNVMADGYAFVNIIKDVHDRLYGEMSERSFNELIKQGEDDKFWGIYKVNGYKVIYLKANSYLCYLRKDRTAIDSTKITQNMLIKSCLILSMKAYKIEAITDVGSFDNIYRTENKDGKVAYVLITTASHYGTYKRINSLMTKLHIKAINEEGQDYEVGFRIVSATKLDMQTEEHFKTNCDSTGFIFRCSDGRYSRNLTNKQIKTLQSGKHLLKAPSVKVFDISKYFKGDITTDNIND